VIDSSHSAPQRIRFEDVARAFFRLGRQGRLEGLDGRGEVSPLVRRHSTFQSGLDYEA